MIFPVKTAIRLHIIKDLVYNFASEKKSEQGHSPYPNFPLFLGRGVAGLFYDADFFGGVRNRHF